MTAPAPETTLAIPDRVRAAVAASLDTKAEAVMVRHLEQVTDFTDYFLIASGTNERQVQAIAEAVEERLRSSGVRPLAVEGRAPAQWVLLDYGDFVVHVFLDETRKYYGLERLWRDAPDVTAEFMS